MINKLNTKFILIFTAILTSVFLLMIFVVRIGAVRHVKNYIEYNIETSLTKLDEGITEVFLDAANYYDRLVREENKELLDQISQGHTLNARKTALVNLVYLSSINTASFADVGWYKSGEFFSVNGYTLPNEQVFALASEHENEFVLGENKDGCIVLVINLVRDFTQTRGCFVFYLMETVISDVCRELGSSTTQSFFMGADGYIFSHSDKEMLGKTLLYDYIFSLQQTNQYQTVTIAESRYILVVNSMSMLREQFDFDCYLVSMLDYDALYGTFDQLNLILAIVAGVALVIGAILAIFRSRSITRSVVGLSDTIDTVIKTGQKPPSTAKKGDEIYQLEKNYDKMITNIFSLMQKSKEDMEVQRKLELDSLQMQINPHFLYNTLDAMVWMAKIKDENEIASLAISLAKFFRLSLHKGDKYILVSEEIELTKNYLEIDKIRFPDKVNVVFDIDEEIKNYKMLKLLIQPLVENTLKYAFVDRRGTLNIRAYGVNDDIVFEVEDDGVGFEVNDDILQKKNDNKSAGSGYGLYNVNERIKLEYGSDYGLTITSCINHGTKATIRIGKKI